MHNDIGYLLNHKCTRPELCNTGEAEGYSLLVGCDSANRMCMHTVLLALLPAMPQALPQLRGPEGCAPAAVCCHGAHMCATMHLRSL
jgi:hypothetical protein